ncbi:hypothetical protein F5H01DRAFT_352371 [Linnemannia elongata]|nr:hypothetical protein F5H01DRAFT_352371 [Linnemannia elongata]
MTQSFCRTLLFLASSLSMLITQTDMTSSFTAIVHTLATLTSQGLATKVEARLLGMSSRTRRWEQVASSSSRPSDTPTNFLNKADGR